jgi:hypothetical protein
LRHAWRVRQPAAPVTIITSDGHRRTVRQRDLVPARPRQAAASAPPELRAGSTVTHATTSTLLWTVEAVHAETVTLATTIFGRPIKWTVLTGRLRSPTPTPSPTPAPPSAKPPCHGYANGCNCARCTDRANRATQTQ